MVYSASAIVAAERFHDPFFFLRKQLFWAVAGFGCLWIAMRLDYRRLERVVTPLLIVSFALLVLVLVPPFGQEINGTRRWFRSGPVSFQPVELAKFALVLYLASFLTRRQEVVKRFSQGLQFDLNYTLSHSLDNGSSVVNTVSGGLVCDLRNLRVCRGPSDFDIRHLIGEPYGATARENRP